MTDDELRAMVREVITRHMAGSAPLAGPGFGPAAMPGLGPTRPLVPAWDPASTGLLHPRPQHAAGTAPAAHTAIVAHARGGVAIAAGPGATVQVHVSHAVFTLPPACDGGHDGPCLNEPDAACNQCGFCQSYGH